MRTPAVERTTATWRVRIACAAFLLTVASGCGTSDPDRSAAESPAEITPTNVDREAATTDSPSTPTVAPTSSTTENVATESTLPTSTAPTSTTVTADVGMAWTTIDITDSTRPTDEVLGPDGSTLLAAAPTRTIPTVLLYPGRDGGGEGATAAPVDPRPLVVWLNGLGGLATSHDPLLLALYDAGYVVAAPNVLEIATPVSHAGGYVHQPGDVSALISALTSPDEGIADDIAAIIDPSRIGVAGHSIGGSGVYGVTFHDCCRDERISAAAVFAPPRIEFDGGEFEFADTPLLIVHGSADQIIALEQSESVRDDAEGALLVVPAGADHFQPVYGSDRPDVLALSEDVLTTFLDVHVAGTASLDDLEGVLEGYDERISVR